MIDRMDYFALSCFLFSHCWLAMPQLVLQADWQEVWHSPQPPFLALSQRLRVFRVLICFMVISSIPQISTRILPYVRAPRQCGECQTSCQSACKTSCGIANQQCENKAQEE